MAAREVHVKRGDREGEHLEMRRGKANAWPHVIFGAVIVALVCYFFLSGLFHGLFSSLFYGVDLSLFNSMLALVLTPVLVAFIYADHWRVNEAYTSRYARELSSIFYVPLVSIGYAMTRFFERQLARFEKKKP